MGNDVPFTILWKVKTFLVHLTLNGIAVSELQLKTRQGTSSLILVAHGPDVETLPLPGGEGGGTFEHIYTSENYK